ncbi:bifunctional hydroxymethylpyrimidine kinase/phosphomethylpyrimidine kinase [Inhella proteolytica]|nr:bifunctional hydroxymethylpyrimidine kinase/phosphomethylpyrimidine kinase [Inhella proteolytica]
MNAALETRPIVWSVAGSDSGGGAGIAADLRAFDALRVHGCTALAALTAQNSVAVQRVQAVDPDLLDAQLAALAADLPPAAIKTGMLGSAANVRVLARWLKRLREQAPVALVIDPVWRASSDGGSLADAELRRALRSELLPLATVCTPNRREAAWLLDLPAFASDGHLLAAVPALQSLSGCSWVVTGGDEGGERARDLLLSPQFQGWLSSPRLDTPHHHGSGCTFASALAGALAQGFCAADAAVLAKMATTQALRAGGPAGQGAGPVRAEPGFAHRLDNLPAAEPLQGLPTLPAFAPCELQGLYAVVDSAAWVERLLAAGVRTLQLRIKRAPAVVSDAALEAELQRAVQAARAAGARLYVNDHWRLALRHGAYGVHLGQEDLQAPDLDLPALQAAGLRLGLSSHSLWELARAVALQPSYLACGPVYPTTTKAMPWRPQGAHNLAWWAGLLAPLPVVAIGGLTPERAVNAARAGAGTVAIASGLTAAADPEGAVAAYQAAWQAGRAGVGLAMPELPRPSI